MLAGKGIGVGFRGEIRQVVSLDTRGISFHSRFLERPSMLPEISMRVGSSDSLPISLNAQSAKPAATRGETRKFSMFLPPRLLAEMKI